MRTNATLISLTPVGTGTPVPRSTRCVFTGATLTDPGGPAAKRKGTRLVPHHELVRDQETEPHGFPKVGDTVVIRLDAHNFFEWGDDVTYTIETARAVPGGPLKHWHYTLK